MMAEDLFNVMDGSHAKALDRMRYASLQSPILFHGLGNRILSTSHGELKTQADPRNPRIHLPLLQTSSNIRRPQTSSASPITISPECGGASVQPY